MKNHFFKLLLLLFTGFLGGLIGFQFSWSSFLKRRLGKEKAPFYITQEKTVKIEENTALKEAIKNVENALVFFEAKREKGNHFQGVGLILTSDGLVVACSDVVSEGDSLVALHKDEGFSFQVLKRDKKGNLVLLKLKGVSNLPTVGFYDLEKLALGERVFLVSAKPYLSSFEKFANEGIVRNFNNSLITTNIFESKEAQGSPLFDIKGNFLGLGEINKEGRVVAIPVSKIKSFAGL